MGPGIWAGDEARIWVGDEAAYADCVLLSGLHKYAAETSSSGAGKIVKFPPASVLTCEIWTDPAHTPEMLSARSMGLEMFKTLSSAVPLLWFQSLPLP